MATITSKEYIQGLLSKKSTGFGVIDINVSDDQVDDRIDEFTIFRNISF